VSTGTGTDIFTYIFLKKVNGETHQSVMSCFFNFLSHFFSPIFFCKNRYIRVTFFTLQFQLFFKKMHSSICNELLFESFYLKKKKNCENPIWYCRLPVTVLTRYLYLYLYLYRTSAFTCTNYTVTSLSSPKFFLFFFGKKSYW